MASQAMCSAPADATAEMSPRPGRTMAAAVYTRIKSRFGIAILVQKALMRRYLRLYKSLDYYCCYMSAVRTAARAINGCRSQIRGNSAASPES
jgi:hypothetical protein